MIDQARVLQDADTENLNETRQTSTNLNSRASLIETLHRGPEARARLVESHLDKGIAFQLRSLREDREWGQQELAARVGMNQNAISRLENPYYGKATLTTLKRLAAAFDVALVCRFVPFSELVNWVSGTPYVESGLSPDTVDVRDFEKEKKEGKFNENRLDATAMLGKLPVAQTIIEESQPKWFDPLINRSIDIYYQTWNTSLGVPNALKFAEEKPIRWQWYTVKSGEIPTFGYDIEHFRPKRSEQPSPKFLSTKLPEETIHAA